MNEDNFLEEEVVFGLIVKGSFEQIRKMKQCFADIDGLELIYQKYTLGKLHIIEDTPKVGDIDESN